ncbi:MAG: DUF4258 domain-containing protein [Anaerolineae bacterium]
MTAGNMPADWSLAHYQLTEHARRQMMRRRISEAQVAQALTAPEQVEQVREGRIVCQTRMQPDETGVVYLLRVFVDIDRSPPEVVTVYRTSKVAKYWRNGT